MKDASFILFDDEGQIQRVVSLDTGGLNVMMGSADDAREYVDVDTMTVVEKPDIDPVIQASAEEVIVTGIPDEAIARLDFVSVTATGGQAVFESPAPGDHRLVIRAPRYKEFKTIVSVPE